METIQYRGIDYPTRELYLNKDYDYVTVGTDALADAIFSDGNSDVNDDAGVVDSQFYYYLPDEIFSKSDKKIRAYLKAEE